LASTVSTHFDNGNPAVADSIDRHPCRPAFSLLGYPVITMDANFTHADSRNNLLAGNQTKIMVDSLSNEKQVNDKTPPGFLFHATDDGLVPIKNSQAYFDSLQKHHIPASLMKFDHGGHGFGMADGKAGAPNDPVLNAWCDSSVKWLDKQGFFTAKPTALAPRSSAAPRARELLFGNRGRKASDALGRRMSTGGAPRTRLPERREQP
jgi:acetyl esterase/lipase